jgi:hypothetical protein
MKKEHADLLDKLKPRYMAFNPENGTEMKHYFDACMLEVATLSYEDSPYEVVMTYNTPRPWAVEILKKYEIVDLYGERVKSSTTMEELDDEQVGIAAGFIAQALDSSTCEVDLGHMKEELSEYDISPEGVENLERIVAHLKRELHTQLTKRFKLLEGYVVG